VVHRTALANTYRAMLPGIEVQELIGSRIAYQFMPVLLPPELAPRRTSVIAGLEARGVGSRHYFSPHLAEQPYFAGMCLTGSLDVTRQIAGRILSLPMADDMTSDEVADVCSALRSAIADAS
jgi:dTDP-4-amino-4,6-dideoxygalactose transaminase